MCATAAIVCTFCGIEGGYQLHLTHEHSALSCLKLGVPVPVAPGDEINPLLYQIAPACKEPDERGQPWRFELVLLDMLGFIVFGTIGAYKSKQLIFAPTVGKP